LGFGWWTFQGWASLVIGTLLILGQMREELGGFAFVLVAVNVALSAMLLKYSKIAFVTATVLSINPLLWIINGIYIKNRWNDPRVLENRVASAGQENTRKTEEPVDPMAPIERRVQHKEAKEIAALAASAPAPVEAVSTEDLWARAMFEADSQDRRPGLWAKCFAESGGVESAAKARYMSARVAELNAEKEAARGEAAEAAKSQERETRLAQLGAEEQAYARLPKGACPACTTVIPFASKECQKCRADFGPGAAWSPSPIES
jgi:hypothetical protein